jgi:hypothetical protein
MLQLTAVHVRCLETRHDFGGTINRHNEVDIPRWHNDHGGLASEGHLKCGGTYHDHVVTDVAEHIGSFSKQPAWLQNLHDQLMTCATASGKAALWRMPLEALIRPSMRRRQRRRAGSSGAANAASRWGTPDRATPVQAVTRSGVDALQGRGTRWDRNARP